MALAIVTGSGGLVGSDSVRRLVESGWEVVGLENDMRARFFGPEASTAHVTQELIDAYPEFHAIEADIRDADSVNRVFRENAPKLELVIHAAAQPSHDWAAREPHTDFAVERGRHAQPAGGGPPDQARGHLRLHVDQQGLRRHAQLPPAR